MNAGAAGGGNASGQTSFKSERSERTETRQRERERERERDQQRERPQSPGNNAHKRSASGNPRNASRAYDDRRVEERRTERTYVTQLETMVQRTRSPDRGDRRGGGEKGKAAEAKSRTADAKPKEAKVDSPQGEIPRTTVLRRRRRLTDWVRSTMVSGGDTSSPHISPPSFSNINTAVGVPSTTASATKTTR